jgi:hypothetical protein
MSEFWNGARSVDAILILTVLETVGLSLFHRYTGR